MRGRSGMPTLRPRAPVAVALVHHPVYGRNREVVTTSVTGSDIHDVARIARTYGAEPYYIVNPVAAQRDMVEAIARKWTEGEECASGHPRGEAISLIRVVPSLADAVADLAARAGGRPAVIVTGASLRDGVATHGDVRRRIAEGRDPGVLIVFGTGWGLVRETVEAADVRLEAIDAGTGFNHLPVRAAVAIVLDRLLGPVLY